jgi:hypothetical protein
VNRTLRHLNLKRNGLKSKGIEALCETLEHQNNTLVALNLGSNNLVSADIARLTKMLSVNTVLTFVGKFFYAFHGGARTAPGGAGGAILEGKGVVTAGTTGFSETATRFNQGNRRSQPSSGPSRVTSIFPELLHPNLAARSTGEAPPQRPADATVPLAQLGLFANAPQDRQSDGLSLACGELQSRVPRLSKVPDLGPAGHARGLGVCVSRECA